MIRYYIFIIKLNTIATSQVNKMIENLLDVRLLRQDSLPSSNQHHFRLEKNLNDYEWNCGFFVVFKTIRFLHLLLHQRHLKKF